MSSAREKRLRQLAKEKRSPPLGEVISELQAFGDECFPVVHPATITKHHIPVSDLHPSEKLGPATAVVAELHKVLGFSGHKLLCWLGDNSFLCIHNAVADGVAEQDDVHKLLPPSRIAIRSCLIAKTENGSKLFIYVPCMAAVEVLGLDERSRMSVWFYTEHKQEQAAAFRRLGNEKFSQNKFVFASLFYSASATAARANRLENELLLATSNHAQCMLKLQRFEEAISSCDKALRIAPHHPKSLFRKGQALSSLQLHTQALAVFRSALEFADEEAMKAALQDAIAKTSVLAHQQRTGEYDVLPFFNNGFNEKFAPAECSDYICDAVEIRITRDGKGRGLFLTRDVEAGKLLLVSNPVVAAPKNAGDIAFVLEGIRSCGRSRRARRIINSLADSHSMTSVPSLQNFMGGSSSSSKDDDPYNAIDVQRVKLILKLASFKLKVSGVGMNMVFGLPGLINHSCLPNSSLQMVGPRALFIRAAKSLKAGEEITVTYIQSLNPLLYRTPRLLEWGFQCCCPRCEVEKLHEHALGSLPDDSTICEQDDMGSLRYCCLVFVSLEEALRRLGKTISTVEKNMIRLGHAEAYVMVAAQWHPEVCPVICSGFDVASEVNQLVRMMRELVPGDFMAVVVIARLGCKMVSGVGVGLIQDAIMALVGKYFTAVDVSKFCEFLSDKSKIRKLACPDE